MRKVVLMALIAMTLAAAVGRAQASRGMRLSSSGPIVASGRLTMNDRTICTWSLTLNATTGTLLKNSTIDQATITAGSITACSSDLGYTSGVILTPINVRYASFSGTLPAITGVNVTFPNFGRQLNGPLGIACLMGGNMTGITLNRNTATGAIASVTFNSNPLPLVRGSFICPATWTMRGTLTVQAPMPTVT